MPYTKLPRSSENVFTGRQNGAVAPSAGPGVRQDKRALPRARAASVQPALVANGTRAHASNTKRPRTQKRHSTKRQTEPLTAWFKPIVAHEIRRIARAENISISAVVAALVEKALQQNIDMGYYPIFKPVMQQTIRESMRSMMRLFAWYMAQIAVTSGQSRHLITNVLGRQPNMTDAKLNAILAQSEKAARATLSRRTPHMLELMQELEAWLLENTAEEENAPTG